MVADNTLRSLLNRLRWDRRRPADQVALLILTRRGGVPCREALPFSQVQEVRARGVLLQDGTYLPFHRVLAVRSGETVLFQARRETDDEA